MDCTTRLNARSTTTKAIRLSSVVFRLNMVSFLRGWCDAILTVTRHGNVRGPIKTRVEETLYLCKHANSNSRHSNNVWAHIGPSRPFPLNILQHKWSCYPEGFRKTGVEVDTCAILYVFFLWHRIAQFTDNCLAFIDHGDFLSARIL